MTMSRIEATTSTRMQPPPARQRPEVCGVSRLMYDLAGHHGLMRFGQAPEGSTSGGTLGSGVRGSSGAGAPGCALPPRPWNPYR